MYPRPREYIDRKDRRLVVQSRDSENQLRRFIIQLSRRVDRWPTKTTALHRSTILFRADLQLGMIEVSIEFRGISRYTRDIYL